MNSHIALYLFRLFGYTSKPIGKPNIRQRIRIFFAILTFFCAYCVSLGQEIPSSPGPMLSRIQFANPETVIVGRIYRQTTGPDAYIVVESFLGPGRYSLTLIRSIQSAPFSAVTVRITWNESEIIGVPTEHNLSGITLVKPGEETPTFYAWDTIQQIEYFFPES